MSVNAPADRTPLDVGRRYVSLFAEPRPSDELRAGLDELVAGDHVAYRTSWGTLLGRTALEDYAEIARAAFPSLSYRVDGFANCDTVVYCQWAVGESYWSRRSDAFGSGPSSHWMTMAIRMTDGLITETWRPCDPWLIP